MPQISTDARPIILKNKKKGNRKTYNKNFDRIFGKTQKNYNRQKG
jgi:hypothetical protein